MPIMLEPDIRQRMPVVFGPMPGPRQTLDGGRYADPTALVESYAATFLTERAAVERLLPACFVLDGEPLVTIEFSYMSELEWLAGRGYNTLGVSVPVRYAGPRETARGPFLLLLWENKADPIITGREELGFAKLFCEIHPPRKLGARRLCSASWEGHCFLELEAADLVEQAPPPAPAADGILHYRYIPRVGAPGFADFEGPVIGPRAGPVEWQHYATGAGCARFITSTWEQLPTLVHIVNTLAALPVLENRGATFRRVRRDVEQAGQRILD